MIEINKGNLCESCFAEISEEPCPHCGYSAESYVRDPAVLPCGSALMGRYAVGRVIGMGGFGITYLAYDIKMGRKIAIKEFFPFGLASRSSDHATVSVSFKEESASVFKNGSEKFYDEARMVAGFNTNPNIVNVYDFFYENSTAYYTMEYLQGQSLKEHISKNGVLSGKQAVYLAESVSAALLSVHGANVLHRDISPDNIMLCNDGKVKLIDFGAARQVVADGSQAMSVILKPGFAPLEQYQKKGKQGPWTDIYSLGTTLFYALTGIVPDDPMTRLEDDEKFSENKYSIDDGLWNIIQKATMLKIKDRYNGISEMISDLDKLSLGIEPIIMGSGVRTVSMPYGMTMRSQTIAEADVKVTATEPEQPSVAEESEPAPEAPKKKKFPGAVVGIASGVVLIAAVICIFVFGKGSSGGDAAEDMAVDITTTTPYFGNGNLYPDTFPITEETEEAVHTTTMPSDDGRLYPDTFPITEETSVSETSVSSETTTVSETSVSSETTTVSKTSPPETTTTTAAIPAVPESITIGGKSYRTDMTGTLNLASKGLTDSDIKDLKYMTSVTEIILSYNELTDLSPLSGLTQLQKLTYHNNKVKDLSYAKNLKKLKVLGAENNGISDLSPLSGMTELTEIWLKNNNFSDVTPLKNCTKVQYLSIAKNPVSDCSAFSGMKKLKGIHLNGCKLKSLEPFSGCTMLEYAYVGENQLTDLTPLAGNTGLRILSAPNNKLNGKCSALKGLTILEELDVSGNGYDAAPELLYNYLCSYVYQDEDSFTYWY